MTRKRKLPATKEAKATPEYQAKVQYREAYRFDHAAVLRLFTIAQNFVGTREEKEWDSEKREIVLKTLPPDVTCTIKLTDDHTIASTEPTAVLTDPLIESKYVERVLIGIK